MPSLSEVIGTFNPIYSLDQAPTGAVLSYHYSLYRHDPYPVIILLRDEGPYLFGINMHYVSFPTVTSLFRQYGDNMNYEQVKNDPRIQSAFRRYKKAAISQPRVRKLSEVIKRMSIPRIYPEHEIERARQDFRQQGESESQPVSEEEPQG